MSEPSDRERRGKQQRGLRTRARLMTATNRVVAEVGYAHATTKRIAAVAGVSEATIYRHFPGKQQMFMSAALESHQDSIAAFERLPERAGTGTIDQNLRPILTRLANMRRELLPLELWMLANPELRREALRSQVSHPPDEPLSRYLAAEQRAGRLPRSLDAEAIALTMLATLFGIAVLPGSDDPETYRWLVEHAITILVAGSQVSGRDLTP